MLEVLLSIGSAYLLKRVSLFSEEQAKPLINYVLYFALPILSFKVGHGLGLSKDVLYIGLGAWLTIGVCLVLAFAMGRLLRVGVADLKSLMILSAFGNTAFLGYPYSYNYFGEEGLSYAVLYDNIGSFLAVSSLGLLVLKGRVDIRSVVLFPPFLGIMAGFLLRGFEIPHFIDQFFNFVSASLLPVVLFAIGLGLRLSFELKDLKLLVLVFLTKMVFSPALAFFIFSLFPLNPIAQKVGVLQSAMPTMIMASLLVIQHNLNTNLAVASAGLGIVLSFLTVPLVAMIINY